METPVKQKRQKNHNSQTTAINPTSNQKQSMYKTLRQKPSEHKKAKIKRNSPHKLYKCNDPLAWKVYGYYKQSLRKMYWFEKERIFNLPKNIASRKRERSWCYDQRRREQTPPIKKKKIIPLKHDHEWNKPRPITKRYQCDEVCNKHRQAMHTISYDELQIKIKRYAKKAMQKIAKQKREKARSQRKIRKTLYKLQLEQAAILEHCLKKRLKRSQSEIERAFSKQKGK